MTTSWERHRSSLVVVAALLAAVLVALAYGAAGTRSGTPLDPDNAGPDGARAVARVLADQGVDVTVVRGADALEATPVDRGTTVVVTSTGELGVSTVERLRRHAASGQVVVVEPGVVVTEQLGIDRLPNRAAPDGPVAASCDDARFDGLEAYADGALAYPASGCFPTADGALLVTPREGLTLLGAGDVLSNEQVTIADNAAVALRLLGQRERLVWYVPDATDLQGSDALDPRALLPDWLLPAVWLVGVAAVALVLWRVRRLGALASEPLPASDPHAVSRAVARHTGRPADGVARLLDPGAPAPATDQELVDLAAQLSTLEEEVRRT